MKTKKKTSNEYEIILFNLRLKSREVKKVKNLYNHNTQLNYRSYVVRSTARLIIEIFQTYRYTTK